LSSPALFKSRDVVDGRGGDVYQCFSREERLVASDDDSRKREQPAQMRYQG